MTSDRVHSVVRQRAAPARRGSVVVIVLWAIAIAAIISTAVQLVAYRQAKIGREAIGRLQARWAARAGIERTMAVMGYYHENPTDYPDAWALLRDMEIVASGETWDATWDIGYNLGEAEIAGPIDEHSKLNVNNVDRATLLLLDRMTYDVADAVLDWIDEDDDPREIGAERDWYANAQFPIVPRNAPLRSIPEMELIAGVFPRYLRGEDWNFNGRLDPNENDGQETLPRDDGNDVLDVGWAGVLTTYSRTGGKTLTGEDPLWLSRVYPEDLMARFGLTEDQARTLINFGRNGDNQMSQLLLTPLNFIAPDGTVASQPVNGAVDPLDDFQLRDVLIQCVIDDPRTPQPGKMNINTVSADLLRQLYPEDSRLVEEILYLRSSRGEGVVSLLDLADIPGIEDTTVLELAQRFDTKSNVYTISSRGRSLGTGAVVEMIAVVDRSSLPLKILEFREQ